MFPLDQTLFLWLTADATSPAWLLELAVFASRQLPSMLLAATAIAFVTGDRHRRHCVARVVLAMAIAWLLVRLFKHLMPMPRPFSLGLGSEWLSHGGSASFPSSHASVAFAFGVGFAAIAQRRTLAAAALLAACLVAWSRIYLGLHFPSDVMAGAGLGATCAWISTGFVGSSLRKASSGDPSQPRVGPGAVRSGGTGANGPWPPPGNKRDGRAVASKNACQWVHHRRCWQVTPVEPRRNRRT